MPKTRGRLVKWLAAAFALLLLYAWIDGGREPLHEIRAPVDLPEAAR